MSGRRGLTRGVVAKWLVLLFASTALAQGGYTTQASHVLEGPQPTTSPFVKYASLPADSVTSIDGYPLGGRLLAATDRSVLLQNNYGSSTWIEVATVSSWMDPAFLEVSPGATRIALGGGFYQPLYVFPPDTLSVLEPPNLDDPSKAWSVDANYYDATWRDERYLLLNAIAPDGGSWVYAFDTGIAAPLVWPIPIITAIDGASAGLAFDEAGNFVTGVGFGEATGEIRIFDADDVEGALLGTRPPLDYSTDGALLIEAVLSAASLGFDASGNLHVGGGDVFGGSGDLGYAALIAAAAVERVLAGGPPADRSDPGVVIEIAPDPCRNDDATEVIYVAGADLLLVPYNAASSPPDCETVDWSGTGGSPLLQLHFGPSATDADGDGVPDAADNAYLVFNPDQLDRDDDGFGDVVDFDFDNDGLVGRTDFEALVETFGASLVDPNFDARFDLDGDGRVSWGDLSIFRNRWAEGPVFL